MLAAGEPATGGANREDLAADFYLFLVDDDFRRLRSYDRSRSFAGWLHRQARGFLSHRIRCARRRPAEVSLAAEAFRPLELPFTDAAETLALRRLEGAAQEGIHFGCH
jgi:DNA-directed RNA polymerase specialized sigma24 family protein